MHFRIRNQPPLRRQAPSKLQQPKPPIQIPLSTLYHSASIQWVNVMFDREDHSITDLQLLRRLEARFAEGALKGETTMVSSISLMHAKPYCVSVQVTGTFETCEDILNDAQVTVNRWIRELPVRGLPFSRGAIFNRGTWEQRPFYRRLRW